MNEQLASHYKPPKPAKYALLTIGTHFITGLLIRVLFANSFSVNMTVRHTIAPVLTYAIPLYIIIRYYLSANVPEQYREGGKYTWLRSFGKLVLPGEGIRMLLSMIPTGTVSLGMFFSPCSWLMTEKLYLYPHLQEAASSAAALEAMTATFVLYPLFYLLYLAAVWLSVLAVTYYIGWQKGRKQYEHLKQVYAEHAVDAQVRDAMPDAAAKVIPEHKEKAFDLYNTFQGKRPKK